MFANITRAVAQTFNTVTTVASAADHAARAVENLAKVAEETSGTYLDNARMDREVKQIERLAAIKEAKAKAIAVKTKVDLAIPDITDANVK